MDLIAMGSISVKRARRGPAAEYYELAATLAQFHVDKNGNCSDVVVVKLLHVKGNTRTEVSTTDKILHVEYDSNVCGDYSLPATLDPNEDDAIGQALFDDKTAFYKVTVSSGTYGNLSLRIPVLYDGEKGDKGDGAITIDLNNEMDSVPCDADGSVFADTTIETKATLYNGAAIETSAIVGWQEEKELALGDVSPSSVVYSNGVATIKWTFEKGTVLSADKYTVIITLTYKDESYSAVFTLNVVKSGAKGESPIIYQLLPSLTSLTFKYSNGAYSPASLPLTCGYTRREGDSTSSVADITSLSSKVIGDKYRIYWRTKLYSGTWGGYAQLTSQLTVSSAAIILVTDYEFCLSTATTASDVSESNIIDRETIPVVKDGTTGATGTSISDADVIFVTGDSETTEPTDEEFDQNGKTLQKDVQRVLGKFLWQGTKITYSNSATSVYRGKMCLGKWDDLISGVEMYTLSDSGTMTPETPPTDKYSWASHFTPEKGKYLWESTKITDSNNDSTYTTPTCIGYFGEDGSDMEFGIDGTAKGYISIGALADGETDSGLIAAYFTKIGYTPQNGNYCLVQIAPQKACVYVYSSSSASWALADSVTLSKGDLWLVSQEKDSTNNGHVFMYVAEESTSSSGVTVMNGSYWNDLGQLQGPKGDTGPTGPEGPGDYNIFRLSVVKDDNMTIPVNSDVHQGTSQDPFVKGGWNADPQGVSEDWPYEYVSTRKRSNGEWSTYSKPVLYANYSSNANPNLLDQAEFKSENQMDKWTTKSIFINGNTDSYTDSNGNSISHIHTGGKDGHNYYADQNAIAVAQDSGYKEVLQQPVIASGIKKIEPLTWYTLSFWERCGSTTKYISWSSSNGSFPTQKLYLNAGHIYRFVFGGYVSTSGEKLRVYLYNSDGTSIASLDITGSGVSDNVLTCTPSANGKFTIGVKLFASDGTSDGTGTATMSYIRVHDTTQQASVYIYPSVIDTSTVYLDGVECSNYAADMSTALQGTQYDEGELAWRQHVITFKTTDKTSMGDTDKFVLFRLMPSPLDGQKAYLHICMPKLEKGKIATSFSKSDSDNVGIDGMLIRDSIWQLGNTYRNDRNKDSWPRILDVVYIERSDGSGYNVWMYNSDDPTVATADNKPSVSSAGLAIDGGLWKAVNGFGPLYTPLLIADNAEFKFGQTNRLLIINSKQEIQGCFGGVEDETNGYPLWIGGKDASSAKFKVKYDGTLEATGAIITGTITATYGKIGGFEIGSNGLTNIVTQDAMSKADMGYIICRNDYYGRFAGIGANVLPAGSGSAAVARFENNDTHSWYSYNIALILQAQGKSSWGYDVLTKNVACAVYGGCFTGFALGVKIINVTEDKTETLDTNDNVVTVIGTAGKTLDLYLPNVHSYNDGYVIIIKRDGDMKINVHPNSFVMDSSYKSSYIRYDKGSILCGSSKYLAINSWMDSMMLIFHAGLSVTEDNVTYYGCWMQYKLPRDW